MKKLFKIGAFSLAIIASLLFLHNVTNAAGGVGTLTLKINAGTSSCVYGTSLDLGQQTASYSALTFSGVFTTPSAFFCDDQNGTTASWTMSMQASNLTNSTSQSISSGLVTMKTSAPTIVNGNCTASAGTTTYTAIGATAGTIVAKTAALGEICKLQATGVRLQVIVPANQAVGTYTGTLTISAPY